MLTTEEEQTEMNFFFLSKKTRRGRKSNFQLPEGPRCTICLEFEEFSSEPIEKCSQCHSLFHYSCYAGTMFFDNSNKTAADNVKKGNFLCSRCDYANKQSRTIESIKCGICNMSNGILEQQERNGDLFYHLFCKRLIPELTEESLDTLRKWRYKNSCHFCKAKLSKSQPVIKCLNSKCKEFYHIPCAIEKGMLFSIRFQAEFYNKKKGDSIPFYCSCHNKRLVNCYKEHMYECNRKSTRYSSDSHSETIEESDKKETQNNQINNKNKFSLETREFRLDFDLINTDGNNNDGRLNTNDHQNYFDTNDQRDEFNLGDNDGLLNFFQMDYFYKEEGNNSFFMN